MKVTKQPMKSHLNISLFVFCFSLGCVAEAQTNSAPSYDLMVPSPTLKYSTNASALFRMATNMMSRSATMDVQLGRKLLLESGSSGYVPTTLWLGSQYKKHEDPLWKIGTLLELGHQDGRVYAKVAAPAGNVVLYDGENPFDTEAVQWFRKAAQKNNADAQYALGEIFGGIVANERSSEPATRESMVSNDSPAAKEAAQWFTLAANQGDQRAMKRLGWYYSAGIGVPRNSGKAMQLYERCDAFYDMAALSLKNSNRVAALVWWGVGNARQKPKEAPFTSEYAAMTFSRAERDNAAQRAAFYLTQRFGSTTNSNSVTKSKSSAPNRKPVDSLSQTNEAGRSNNSSPFR